MGGVQSIKFDSLIGKTRQAWTNSIPLEINNFRAADQLLGVFQNQHVNLYVDFPLS